MELPKESFVEVYVGKNAYIDQKRKQELNGVVVNHQVDNFEKLKEICSGRNIPLNVVSVDLESWSLKSKQIDLSGN